MHLWNETTWPYIPEVCHLQDNLKFFIYNLVTFTMMSVTAICVSQFYIMLAFLALILGLYTHTATMMALPCNFSKLYTIQIWWQQSLHMKWQLHIWWLLQKSVGTNIFNVVKMSDVTWFATSSVVEHRISVTDAISVPVCTVSSSITTVLTKF
jgi:hypothetical protein